MGFNLTDWDDKEDIAPASSSGRDAGPEVLQDGKHELEILKASHKDYRSKDGSKSGFILKMKLLKLDSREEVTFSFDTFCTDDESFARLKRMLITLGFDVDMWKQANGRPFSKELPKAIRAMSGMRFIGAKATNKSGNKEFHNLYVNSRLEGDGKPLKYGPDELNQAANEIDPDDPF